MIIVCKDPFLPRELEYHRFTGPLINWLQEEYPTGFGAAAAVVMHNGRKLPVEDFDTEVLEGDEVAIITVPMAGLITAAVIKTALVSAAVGMALNYAISWIVGTPDAPSSALADAGKASPVYSLSVPTNQARLGQTIPVSYGRVLAVPDISAQPYTWFEDNEQYLGMILNLGHGDHTVESLQVADSLVSEMPAGVFQWWDYPESAHGQTFGTIYAGTGIYENMDTSPEVSDQELVDPENAQSWASIGGTATTIVPVDGVPAFCAVGSPVLIFWSDTEPPLETTMSTIAGDNLSFTTPIDVSAAPDPFIVRMYATEASEIGPFTTSAPGKTTSLISVDLVMPGGLYAVDTESGSLQPMTVEAQFTAQEIDDTGAPTATPPIVWLVSHTANTKTPQRITDWKVVTDSRYQVSCELTSLSSVQASDQDQVVWTGLKAVITTDTAVPVYGDTHLIPVKMQATNGIASGAQNRIGIWNTRKLDGEDSVNPADTFLDVYTNTVYGGARPVSELDPTKLENLKTAWETHNGFNGVFDAKETVWTALQRSVQVVNAYPVVVDGLVSIVQDGPNSTITRAFTESNMVESTLRISYRFDEPDDIDGYEVEYRDPVSFLPKYATYPTNALNVEKVVLFGCTCSDTDQNFAQLLWQKRLYRRKSIVFDTELVGLIPAVNDRISIQHRLIDDGKTAERYIVTSIRPGDGYRVSIEAMIDDDRVFASTGLALTGVRSV